MSTFAVYTWDANKGTPEQCHEDQQLLGTSTTLSCTATWEDFYTLAELTLNSQILTKGLMNQRWAIAYDDGSLIEIESIMGADQFYHQDREKFPTPYHLIKFCFDPENTVTWFGTWTRLTIPKDLLNHLTQENHYMALCNVVPFTDCLSFARLKREDMIKELDDTGLWSRSWLESLPIGEIEHRLAWLALLKTEAPK